MSAATTATGSRTRRRPKFLPFAWQHNTGGRVSVLQAVLVFALSGLTALALVALGVVLLARRTATDEAVRDARSVTELVALGMIEPAIDDALVSGDPAAFAAMDDLVRRHVVGGPIARVKMWTEDGRVVYSDEPRLVGRQFKLADDEVEAFRGRTSAAEVSDLERPENEYERGWQKLLEVYFPVHTPAGVPVLFEAYLPYTSISSSGQEIWRAFLPALIAGLVLLELIQLPLAWSLAQSLRRGQDERELLLTRAVEASERERRVIAGELHDGAVQDLVGQSYRLVATADRLAGIAPDDAIQVIRDAAARTRSTVQGLRSLLVDLYPPNLRSEGIEHALSDLAAPLRAKGVGVTISAPAGIRLPEDAERLLYRAAREALRNVLQHANAHRVEVGLDMAGAAARLTVVDDGRGFAPSERAEHRLAGHLGLDLIENLVRESGGSFSIGPGDGGGTRFEVEVLVK